jgi:hypothetical protein
MNENPDLSARLQRNGGKRSRQFDRRDVIRGNAAPVEALEGAKRGRGQADLVAVDFDDPFVACAAALGPASPALAPRFCREAPRIAKNEKNALSSWFGGRALAGDQPGA